MRLRARPAVPLRRPPRVPCASRRLVEDVRTQVHGPNRVISTAVREGGRRPNRLPAVFGRWELALAGGHFSVPTMLASGVAAAATATAVRFRRLGCARREMTRRHAGSQSSQVVAAPGGLALAARCPHEAPVANLNGNLVVVARLA